MHITGTNGKGSTAAFVSSMLAEMGHKTGLFTSPHLSDVRERIKINGKNISRAEFCSLLNEARAAYESFGAQPSFFELMLVIAVLHFYKEKCDFVIAEVGIGGRLDSTNVLNGSVCSITGIDYDHIEYLGGTLRQIASEKAAIVKPGSILTVNVDDDELFGFIKQQAESRNAAAVVRVSEAVRGRVISAGVSGTDFIIDSGLFKGVPFHIPLIGDYQFQNARCALAIIEALIAQGHIAADSNGAARGLKKTFWPGRFEIIHNSGLTVVLDGAHNVNGMQGLARNLKFIFAGKKIRAIISILSSKQYDEMLKTISCVCSELIIVGINNIKKNVEVGSLIEHAKKYHGDVKYFGEFKSAIDYVRGSFHETDVCCVTGSLYLVGEARSQLSPAASEEKSMRASG
ncbi:MAG: Folylpolyglutamate synthase [bacterium ADurb.Bin243]|nr:MAG: Folylpolyglutamate synthase [bacterium ADurb.Bin243]